MKYRTCVFGEIFIIPMSAKYVRIDLLQVSLSLCRHTICTVFGDTADRAYHGTTKSKSSGAVEWY